MGIQFYNNWPIGNNGILFTVTGIAFDSDCCCNCPGECCNSNLVKLDFDLTNCIDYDEPCDYSCGYDYEYCWDDGWTELIGEPPNHRWCHCHKNCWDYFVAHNPYTISLTSDGADSWKCTGTTGKLFVFTGGGTDFFIEVKVSIACTYGFRAKLGVSVVAWQNDTEVWSPWSLVVEDLNCSTIWATHDDGETACSGSTPYCDPGVWGSVTVSNES